LRVDRHTIYRWLREGRMKGIKFAGQYRISESQLREFLGQNEATEETNDG
jgi:excisionase family DNA binding protein